MYRCTNYSYTVEPQNNGQVEDERFVHCSEVVPSSEVEMYGELYRQGVNRLSKVSQSIRDGRFGVFVACKTIQILIKDPWMSN